MGTREIVLGVNVPGSTAVHVRAGSGDSDPVRGPQGRPGHAGDADANQCHHGRRPWPGATPLICIRGLLSFDCIFVQFMKLK